MPEYARAVEHTRLFLEGRNEELLEDLQRQMRAPPTEERFEQAAQLRDAHSHRRDAARPQAEDGDARCWATGTPSA